MVLTCFWTVTHTEVEIQQPTGLFAFFKKPVEVETERTEMVVMRWPGAQ